MLFQYTYLAKDAIRLVRFHPRSTPADIHLTLEHQERYSEGGGAPYAALSYHPSEEDDKSLTLHGRTRMVPAPVWDALSAIQAHHHTVERFWIDAICINQRDENEKYDQLAQMGKIFSRAEKVLAWCGIEDGDTEKAFKTPQDKNAVERLLQRPYFQHLDSSLLRQAQHVELICGRFRCDMSLIDKTFAPAEKTHKNGYPVL